MKKFRSIIASVVLVFAFIALFTGNVPKFLPVILMAISAALYLWSSLGSYYFAKANRMLQTGKSEDIQKSRVFYERAYKAGVPYNYELMIATLMVQYFDYEKGGKILANLTKCRDKKIAYQAKTSLSMYFWIKKDYDRAIEICEEARETHLKDRNLYINLCTYYLAKGDVKKFKITLKEAYRNKLQSPALLDLEGVSQMFERNFERAGGFLKALFEVHEPRFIDPYIHYALIYLHYGESKEAIKVLKKGLELCTFTNTSVIKEDGVNKLINTLQDERYRDCFIHDINEDILKVINGILPDEREGSVKMEYPPLPEFKSETLTKEDLNVKDPSEVDTSLTEEDEAWLKKHNL